MKAISLYTGAGGLDLGLEAAGFEVAVALEQDADCVETVQANRDWPLIDRDIHEVTNEEILTEAALEEREADLLVGGPPCQPFSKSGYWSTGDTQRLDDPRASTLERYLSVLRDAKPKAFLLENVPGLGYRGKDEGLRLLEEVIEDINDDCKTSYEIEVQVLNAVEFGVPQERKRLFIVGHRGGQAFTFPQRTHTSPSAEGEAQLSMHDREPYRRAWDALGDLEVDRDDPELQVTGKWADLLPSIPEGSNYLHHTPRGDGLPLFGWRTRFWNFLLKLSKTRPSWTITAQPGSATGPFHWESRRLSARELCRLQTFPDDYEITGSLRSAQKQLGNAVPPALAERLGWAIRDQLLGYDGDIPSQSRFVPPYREEVPPPEPVQEVPKKYHSRIGDHDPHPGKGKGPGAQSRDDRTTAQEAQS